MFRNRIKVWRIFRATINVYETRGLKFVQLETLYKIYLIRIDKPFLRDTKEIVPTFKGSSHSNQSLNFCLSSFDAIYLSLILTLSLKMTLNISCSKVISTKMK